MKHTKMILPALIALALGLTALGVTGCSKSEHDHSASEQPSTAAKTQYTCRMHPEVVQDKPGKCPKCGMDLVEKK